MVGKPTARAAFPQLPLLESSPRLVPKWLNQVGQRGSTGGFNKDIDRHAGYELGSAQPRELLSLGQYPSGIIAGTGSLILSEIGRDQAHLSLDFRSCLLIERGEPHRRELANIDLIDV